MNDGEYDELVRRSRTDAPEATRRLGAVLRFTDVFTHTVLQIPLRVTIPQLGWEAFRSASDATYRFSVIGDLPTAQDYDVEVEAPGGEYVTQASLQVRIPRPGVPHTPPLLPADYLVGFHLWPTSALHVGSGETAVLGRVVGPTGDPLEAHRVFFFTGGTLPPTTPWAPTNVHGDFLYRLPGLGKSSTGQTTQVAVELDVAVHDAACAPVTVQSVQPGGTPPNKLTVNVGSVSPAVTISIS